MLSRGFLLLLCAGCGPAGPARAPLVATWQTSASLDSLGSGFAFIPIGASRSLAGAYEQHLTLAASGRFTSEARVQLLVPVQTCSMGYCHLTGLQSDCLVSATYEGTWVEPEAGVLSIEAITQRGVSWVQCRDPAEDRTGPDGPISGEAAQVHSLPAAVTDDQLELDFGVELSAQNGTRLVFNRVR